MCDKLEHKYNEELALMVDTIYRMYEGYMKQDIDIIRSPSQSDCEGMVCSNMIMDTDLKLKTENDLKIFLEKI